MRSSRLFLSIAGSGTEVSATTDALVVTEYPAGINAATNVSAANDSLVITGQQATVGFNQATVTATLSITPHSATIEGARAAALPSGGGGNSPLFGGGAKFTPEDNADRRRLIEGLYADLIGSDAPKGAKKKAAEVVRPHLKSKPGRPPKVPSVDRVDWSELAQQIEIIDRLIALHEAAFQEEVGYFDDELLILLLAA